MEHTKHSSLGVCKGISENISFTITYKLYSDLITIQIRIDKTCLPITVSVQELLVSEQGCNRIGSHEAAYLILVSELGPKLSVAFIRIGSQSGGKNI